MGEPLAEERRGVRVPARRRREELGVARPARALVALRTVRRNRQVVRQDPPADVLDQPVDARVPRRDRAALHLLRDGADGHARNALDLHRVRRGNRDVAIAEEREGRTVLLPVLAREGVDDAHAVVGDAQVRAVDAALRAVAPAPPPVRIIQHLTRKCRENRPPLRTEAEKRLKGDRRLTRHVLQGR